MVVSQKRGDPNIDPKLLWSLLYGVFELSLAGTEILRSQKLKGLQNFVLQYLVENICCGDFAKAEMDFGWGANDWIPPAVSVAPPVNVVLK